MSEAYRTTLEIASPPEQVFEHFVRPELLVRWMGDFARLEAVEGGVFSVDINGVLIRGHFVTVERPRLLEIAWGEAGNAQMPPGATRLRVRFEATAAGTRVELEHLGLMPEEAKKHAVGWPHFVARLAVAAAGQDPGPDPWKTAPPRRPIVLKPGEGRAWPMGRISASFKADGAETAGAYSISEWWLEPHTRGPGSHAHPEDDVFYVIEGTMSIRVGDEWVDAPVGSFVLVPGGVTHDFENRTGRRAGVLNFFPGVFEPAMKGIAAWFAEHPPGDAGK